MRVMNRCRQRMAMVVTTVAMMYTTYWWWRESLERHKIGINTSWDSYADHPELVEVHTIPIRISEKSYSPSEDLQRLTEYTNSNSTLPFQKIVFLKRRQHIRSWCLNAHLKENIDFTVKYSIQYFFNYNATVCTISKSGSSTWRRHLRMVNKSPARKVRFLDDPKRIQMLNRSQEEVVNNIMSSSRIITVRHPLTRLVSAYRSKYGDGDLMRNFKAKKDRKSIKHNAGSTWSHRFWEFWLPAMHTNGLIPADAHVRLGLEEPINPNIRYKTEVYKKLYYMTWPRINFRQFITYVIDSFKDGQPNSHWKPYYGFCSPCYFDYQYVIKMEYMTKELRYVFEELGLPSDPSLKENPSSGSAHETYFSYYKWLPKDMIREIKEIFRPDMEMFGYNWPKHFRDV